MKKKPVFQKLFQEDANFPFSWKTVNNPIPCRFIPGQAGSPSELELTPQDIECLREKKEKIHEYFMKIYFHHAHLQLHLHDHCQITQCLTGKMIYLFETYAVVLLPGDILLINSMTPHAWITVEANTMRHLLGFYPQALSANEYSQCFLPHFRLLYSQRYPIIHLHSGSNYECISNCLTAIDQLFLRKCFAFDAMIHDRIYELSVTLLFATLDAELLQTGISRGGGTLKKALNYIDEHINDELSIRIVANHVGLNPSYFSFYFKKHMGISYKQYTLIQRVTKAANLLQYSDYSVSQILFNCGFSSVTSFYDAFHRIYALPPAQFRKLTTRKMYDASN